MSCVVVSLTPVYAAMVAVPNTRTPEVGELRLARMVSQFRRAYARNGEVQCLGAARFLAQLVNHRVAHA
jgi:pre-mRNA-splicing factor CWC22